MATKRGAFERAVDLVLELEGGEKIVYDRGGVTKWGISSRANPGVDVKKLTRAAAVAIYRARYWNAVRADELPPALAVIAFDAAVNQGVPAAIKMLQGMLGVATDGVIGPATLTAAQGRGAIGARLLTVRRLRRYASTPDYSINGAGWFDRALRVFEEALKLTP